MNYYINQGNVCWWCNINQAEKNSDYCATCEHQIDFTSDFDIDECDELDYNKRLSAGFAQLQASEDDYSYQYYWS